MKYYLLRTEPNGRLSIASHPMDTKEEAESQIAHAFEPEELNIVKMGYVKSENGRSRGAVL